MDEPDIALAENTPEGEPAGLNVSIEVVYQIIGRLFVENHVLMQQRSQRA